MSEVPKTEDYVDLIYSGDNTHQLENLIKQKCPGLSTTRFCDEVHGYRLEVRGDISRENWLRFLIRHKFMFLSFSMMGILYDPKNPDRELISRLIKEIRN